MISLLFLYKKRSKKPFFGYKFPWFEENAFKSFESKRICCWALTFSAGFLSYSTGNWEEGESALRRQHLKVAFFLLAVGKKRTH